LCSHRGGAEPQHLGLSDLLLLSLLVLDCVHVLQEDEYDLLLPWPNLGQLLVQLVHHRCLHWFLPLLLDYNLLPDGPERRVKEGAVHGHDILPVRLVQKLVLLAGRWRKICQSAQLAADAAPRVGI
jgi:hypothetical protein